MHASTKLNDNQPQNIKDKDFFTTRTHRWALLIKSHQENGARAGMDRPRHSTLRTLSSADLTDIRPEKDTTRYGEPGRIRRDSHRYLPGAKKWYVVAFVLLLVIYLVHDICV